VVSAQLAEQPFEGGAAADGSPSAARYFVARDLHAIEMPQIDDHVLTTDGRAPGVARGHDANLAIGVPVENLQHLVFGARHVVMTRPKANVAAEILDDPGSSHLLGSASRELIPPSRPLRGSYRKPSRFGHQRFLLGRKNLQDQRQA